jgi:pimeloyl-ACP methyl ester carboxylesterase
LPRYIAVSCCTHYVRQILQIIVRLVSIALLLYGAACIALFAFQRSLIYFPQPSAFDTPSTTLTLPVPGADVVVSVRQQIGQKALIYFGGNAEDVSASLSSFSSAFPDYAIYLLHYRGYGGSSGKASEEMLGVDAEILFDKVHAEHPNIAVVGRSLGTGVAIRLASQRPVSRLVLVTPYDSIQEIAAQQFPYFPVRWLLKDKFESWRYAPKIRIPTLLIAAEFDEVIPRANTERLNAAFTRDVTSLVIIPGVGHNTISNTVQYLDAMRAAL